MSAFPNFINGTKSYTDLRGFVAFEIALRAVCLTIRFVTRSFITLTTINGFVSQVFSFFNFLSSVMFFLKEKRKICHSEIEMKPKYFKIGF